MRQLYLHHARYLTAVCARYVADCDLEDVLQDSFVKIFTSIEHFEYRGEGSLRGWMVRIVINESLKFMQKNQELRMKIVQYENELPDMADEQEDEENLQIACIPIIVIRKMISSLPAGYRTVFNLYVFEGLEHKEISQLLNISEVTSASQYHRAKKLLVQMMTEYKNKNKHNK